MLGHSPSIDYRSITVDYRSITDQIVSFPPVTGSEMQAEWQGRPLPLPVSRCCTKESGDASPQLHQFLTTADDSCNGYALSIVMYFLANDSNSLLCT